MSYNEILFGKIRNIDYKQGVGEIVTTSCSYMFTTDCILDDDLNIGDFVKFRAESIHGNNRAYFINKLDLSKNLNDYRVLKSKKYIHPKE